MNYYNNNYSLTVNNLPASNQRLETYRVTQAQDPICSRVINYCKNGWPERKDTDAEVVHYWQERGNLTIHDNLLLYSEETLEKIHQGHQGILRCCSQVRVSVWWPGMSKHIEEFVRQCPTCVNNWTPKHEPLLTTEIPGKSWEPNYSIRTEIGIC